MDYSLKMDIATRLMEYIDSGRHPLRPTQVKVLVDVAAHLETGHDYGYVKSPTGTGKTVDYVAEVAAVGMPALIITPRTNLTTQIHDTFLNRKLFDFDPEEVGVYHAKRTYEEKSAALKAPILITTFASYANLSKRGDVSGKERPIVILDEVHHARGDVVRSLVQQLFGDVYVQGWTATDTFITGQNIGYYLFNGQSPIHVTTIPKAVRNGEIAPYKNIIVETHMNPKVKVSGLRDYTQIELDRIVRESGRDEAAIRLFLELYDEETGLTLRDMKSIWYCAGVDHAERVAEKLTDIFGENYALAVSGKTSKKDLMNEGGILDMHRKGEIPILVNADLLIEGFDSPSTQLAMMLRPTRSPIVAEQTGGRILRIDPNNPDKIGYIVTLVDEEMYDVVPFGVVAGNMLVGPKGITLYPSRTPTRITKDGEVDYYDFPEVSDIEVHTTQIALEEFVRRRYEYLRTERKSRRLTQQQIDEIIQAHETYGGNVHKALRHLPYSPPTIQKYWRQAGLRIKTRAENLRLSQQQIEEIVAAHPTYHGNASEAAQHLSFTAITILAHWKEAGLEIGSRGRPRLLQQQIDEIIKAYETYGGNSAEAARNIPYNGMTIMKYWKMAGLKTLSRKRPIPQQIDEIIQAHETYGGIANVASKHLPYAVPTILKYWREAGLKEKRPSRHPSDDEKAEIINAHSTYHGNASEAAQHLSFTAITILAHWKRAGLQPGFSIPHFSDDQKVEIINAHSTYHGNASKAAQHLPYSSGSFIRYWKLAGLRTTTHEKRGKRLIQDKIDEIIQAHETYGGIANVASKHLPYTVPTILKYWREAGLKTREIPAGRIRVPLLSLSE